MPYDKRTVETGRSIYETAVSSLQLTLSEEDMNYLYAQQVIGIDPKSRIILESKRASAKPKNERIDLFEKVNRQIIKRRWAGGIVIKAVRSSCESRPPYKRLLFLPRQMVTMTLPHRKIKKNAYVRHDGDLRLSFHVDEEIGLPYGTYARLILMYLTTERVRSKDRRFELKSTWRAFLQNMELPWGGNSYRQIKEQLFRLCSTTFSTHIGKKGEDEKHDSLLITDRWFHSSNLIEITFSDSFFNLTQQSVIPLEADKVRQLKRSPLALDIYAWLTYRAHRIDREHFISWGGLRKQFGSSLGRERDFRSRFKTTMNHVLSLNPVAPYVAMNRKGLRLAPNNPADMEWIERQIAKATSLTRAPLII
ncbi:MAG: replication protein RepA [Bryobacterales bacterium]|nr:replication protein RepA [Bryobacterales bacterium]MDE0296133.1 replication protein RepA [Bryobacterales bacterium]